LIQGITKNLALPPVGYKDLNIEETLIPYNIDLKNGVVTDAGSWEKRPGYSEWKDFTLDEYIDLLIPVGLGYAVTHN